MEWVVSIREFISNLVLERWFSNLVLEGWFSNLVLEGWFSILAGTMLEVFWNLPEALISTLVEPFMNRDELSELVELELRSVLEPDLSSVDQSDVGVDHTR